MLDARLSPPDSGKRPPQKRRRKLRLPQPLVPIAFVATMVAIFCAITGYSPFEEEAIESVALRPEKVEVAITKTFESVLPTTLVTNTEPDAQPSAGLRTFSVRVLDDDGVPIAGIPISATGVEGGSEFGTQATDVLGVSRFSWLLTDALNQEQRVQIHIPTTEELIGVDWEGDVPGAQLEITMHKGARMQGRVSFAGSNRMPEGILDVSWWLSETQHGEVEAPIVNGSYVTLAQLAGSVTKIGLRRTGRPYLQMEFDPILVGPEQEVTRDLVFDPAAPLTLFFVNESDQRPLRDVVVTPSGLDAKNTGRDGSVTFHEAVPFGDSIRVTAVHPDTVPFETRVEHVERGEDLVFGCTLSSGHELSGTVVGPKGELLKNLRVECSLIELSESGSHATLFSKESKTDDKGRFQLRGIPKCRGLHLTFWQAESAVGHFVINVPSEDQEREWRIGEPIKVQGVVLDYGGQRVGTTTKVEARTSHGGGYSSVFTARRGMFEISLPFAGDWMLYVRHGASRVSELTETTHYALTGTKVTVAPKGFYQFKIQLPRPKPRVPRRTPVNLHLSHVVSGEPIKSCRSVEIWGIDNDLHAQLTGSQAASDGTFVLDLDEGRYEIRVASDDYEPFWTQFELDASRVLPLIDARLIPRD